MAGISSGRAPAVVPGCPMVTSVITAHYNWLERPPPEGQELVFVLKQWPDLGADIHKCASCTQGPESGFPVCEHWTEIQPQIVNILVRFGKVKPLSHFLGKSPSCLRVSVPLVVFQPSGHLWDVCIISCTMELFHFFCEIASYMDNYKIIFRKLQMQIVLESKTRTYTSPKMQHNHPILL